MPVACQLSFGRRAQQAFVSHHVFRTLTRNALAKGNNRGRNLKFPRPPAPSLLTALYAAFNIRKAPALHLRSDDVSYFTAHGDPTAMTDNELDTRQNDDYLASTEMRLLRNTLARRIYAMTLAEDEVESLSTTPVEINALHAAGYSLEDLDNWVDALTERDSMRAAAIIVARPKHPSFLFDYFLRRRHVAPDALRLLIHHLPTWHSFASSVSHPTSPGTGLAGSTDAGEPIFRIFVRILRHCRRVWPEALESAATFLVQSLSHSLYSKSSDPMLRVRRLTHIYNRALYLLAEPPLTHPHAAAPIQETAQGVILRHMLSHDPPLIINREGYRGVLRVQLASEKTASDREWARLKSPSWPPWREDHTGMDAHIGLEYGISRAHQVLIRMQEAGYPLHEWDEVAKIYTGWDTDSSPTIQERVLLPSFPDTQTFTNTWVARIRTTRTAQQAWACFLAYQDECSQPDQLVYLAMFEVLVQERKRLRLGPENIGHERLDDRTPQLYPGDTKEIGSPPSSTHQLTYTRTEIPTIQQLFGHMREQKLLPYGRTLEILVKHAESLEEGLAYFRSSAQQHHMPIEVLFKDTINHEDLQKLPDAVFAAYIDLLCRFPGSTKLAPISPIQYNYGNWDFRLRQPLSRAVYLLVKQGRQYLPAWNSLLRGLARRDAPLLSTSWRDHTLMGQDLKFEQEMYDKIFAMMLARRIMATMREIDLAPDTRTFRSLCITAEHAAVASHKVIDRYGSKPLETETVQDSRLVTRAKKTIKKTPVFLRRQFQILVFGRGEEATSTSDSKDGEIELPRLMVTPHPAILHIYIRALGLSHDHDGLEEVVRWMVGFKQELHAKSQSRRNGDPLMRRALTAMRIYMCGNESEPFSAPAKTRQIVEVKALVDSVEEWGGWATDEEVDIYLARKEQPEEGL